MRQSLRDHFRYRKTNRKKKRRIAEPCAALVFLASKSARWIGRNFNRPQRGTLVHRASPETGFARKTIFGLGSAIIARARCVKYRPS